MNKPLLDGRYRLLKKLGTGSSATVWLAADTQAEERAVAVKIIKDRALKGRYTLDRLALEAKILTSLAHPNIVAGSFFKVDDDVAYIAMEYVEGVSLARKISDHSKHGEPIKLDELGAIFRQICAAVSAAHQRGVIHRDLKPKNVMVFQKDGRPWVKVIDFGVARSAERPPSESTTVGRIIGSYLFMSPEQVAGNVADERSDIFALGCILFELLTLRRAWARDAAGRALPVHASLLHHPKNALGDLFGRLSSGERPKPSDYDPRSAGELDALIARALACAPAARYASVAELAAVLETINFAPSGSSAEPTALGAASARRVESGVAFARIPVAEGGPELAPTIARTEVAPAEVADTALLAREPLFARPPENALFWVTGVLLFAVLALAVATWSAPRTEPPPDRPPVHETELSERAHGREIPKAENAAAQKSEQPDAIDSRPGVGGLRPTGTLRPAPREEKAPAPVLTKRTRPTKKAARPQDAPALSDLSRLAAELDEVRNGARPAGALAAIGREIIDRAASVEDLELQQRIKRMAYASSLTADVEGMTECLELLRNNR